jgi:hypothetical protein
MPGSRQNVLHGALGRLLKCLERQRYGEDSGALSRKIADFADELLPSALPRREIDQGKGMTKPNNSPS